MQVPVYTGPKVIGLGFAKTGTTTFRRSLERLGLDVVGFQGELVHQVLAGNKEPALTALAGHSGAANWPWALLGEDIDQAFPGSKFVVTVRESPDTWIQSMRAQEKKRSKSAYRNAIYGVSRIRGNEDMLLKLYEDHNQRIHNYFSAPGKELIELCFEKGEGWAELCEFLDLPIPEDPFPHENKSQRGR